MAQCSFCNKTVEPGTGKLYVLKTGKTLNFCSMKCEKNMLKLKRNPVKVKWTKSKKE